MDEPRRPETADNWRAVDRWFAPASPTRDARRSWRDVITALGSLGRDVHGLGGDSAAVSPELHAHLDQVAQMLEEVAQRIAVAIGDTPVAHMPDPGVEVLAIDSRTRDLLASLDDVTARVHDLRDGVARGEQTLAQIDGAPERVADAERTIKGTADDVVALAARAAIEIERVEMTLRTLQAGEEHVHKAVAELEATTSARTQSEQLLSDLRQMVEAARTEREMMRQALQDVERMRAELRSRLNRPIDPVPADPRHDSESQIRQVVHELRPLIAEAVRKPATPEQIDRLRTVMLEIADADLPSTIEQLRGEAYALLRDAGVSPEVATPPQATA